MLPSTPTPPSALVPDRFFFTDTATTEIYTLSLHDALPIFRLGCARRAIRPGRERARVHHIIVGEHARGLARRPCHRLGADRKSTRLNSSHVKISYAVFCLKKKKIRDIASDLATDAMTSRSA